MVVTGSAAERPLATAVAVRAGLPPAAVLAGRTDLLGLAALVAGARLVVCGDTGLGHLATAYRTPSVLLFGPTPAEGWGPPAAGRSTWCSGAAPAAATRTPTRRTRRCSRSGSAEVLAAAEALLARVGRRLSRCRDCAVATRPGRA